MKNQLFLLLELYLMAAPGVMRAQFVCATNTDNTLTISAYTGAGGVVAIPEVIDGLPVAVIGGGAFSGSAVTSVSIPGSVTDIEVNAFEVCSSLTNVLMSNGVTTLKSGAFFSCAKLASVTIPASVTAIGSVAFASTALSNVFISSNVTALGYGAFNSCANLIAIMVDAKNPDYLSVGGVLFTNNQSSLIQYPSALGGSYTIPDGVTNVGDYAFTGAVLTNVIFPGGLLTIGVNAFQDCAHLTNRLILSDSVATIGGYAFEDSAVTSVTLGEGVESVGVYAFLSCPKLTNIAVVPQNARFSSLDGVLLDKAQFSVIEFPGGRGGSYAVPPGVTNIGDQAFQGSASLTNLTLPGSLLTIGSQAFQDCPALSYIAVPGSVTNIKGYAFYGCGLTNVALPASVLGLGDDVFAACSKLAAITADANNPSFSGVNGVLFDKGQRSLLQYPPGSSDRLYMVPAGVTNIAGNSFLNCSHLTCALLPNSVIGLRPGAFFGCANLATVYFAGDAPAADTSDFNYANNSTLYYLPGATGWSSTFAGRPALPWSSVIASAPGAFPVRDHEFVLNLIGAEGLVVALDVTPSLAAPVTWSPLRTITLTNGLYEFTEAFQAAPSRFYRVRLP